MKIRPRNIPKFQPGGSFNLSEWIKLNPEYYKWYSSIYPNALVLQGSPLKQRNDLWNKNQLSSSHYTTDDLLRSAYNNYLYTNDYDARSEDLIRWGESLKDFGTISDRDFVNRYNNQAQTIRSAREAPQTYNKTGYTDTNRTFRNMFYNRSRQGTNTPLYTIGYLDNIEDIEGTSTWQRRMDRYEKPFNEDTPEGQKNRTFFITRPDGTKIKVYKKQNGNIGLFNDPNDPESPKDPKQTPETPEKPETQGDSEKDKVEDPSTPTANRKYNLERLLEFVGGFRKYVPNLLSAGRLAGNLLNNNRVYDEALKGVRPDLKQTYYTHRQVVGDEATKQAYYRRAAEGQTKAGRPFTSDADRQMAYQFEAKRVGDELRAQGDLADNQEIRRTSDESNQHQWANILRATEVANANVASINAANALRHNLLAQKHSANWTSWDNYLKEIEYRQRQKAEEREALAKQIWMLDEENRLESDENYNRLLKEADDALKSGDAKKISDAKKNLRMYKRSRTLDMYRRMYNGFDIDYAKDGTKLTYKKKDDLLYKSTRDAVEHFRKMSKMSSDAQNRRKPKIERLAPHPKGSTRKYLLGGLAPFTVYTPVALGGERSTSSSSAGGSSSSSKKSEEGKDALDMIKELFKQVALHGGLLSDVNVLYKQMSDFLARADMFGDSMDTQDVASMYLSTMLKLNNISSEKARYDLAKNLATQNEALGEFAVTSDGRYIVQDKNNNGAITATSIASFEEMLKNGLVPLTNLQLLDLREYTPGLAFDYSIFQHVSNGIGISKIGSYVKSILPEIKLNITKLDKYISTKLTNGIKALEQAPEGDYKQTITDKNLKEQADYALNYILGMLPINMRAIINIHAVNSGQSVESYLASLIKSHTGTEYSEEYTAVTGKAADKDGVDSDKISSNPLLAMLREIGGIPQRYELVTRDSNTLMSVNGTNYSVLPKVKNDMSIDLMLSTSGIDGILQGDKRGITFGDQLIEPENLKDIMYSNSGNNMIVTLPCKIVNGRKQVNLDIVNLYEKAEQEAIQEVGGRTSPKFAKVLGEKLKEANLDSLLDSNGYPNKNMFAQFLVVEAYATDKINLDKNSKYIEKLSNPGSVEERMSKALSTNDKKNDYSVDSKNHWYEMFYDDIYRGSIFIPLNNNANAAMNSWGTSLKIELSEDLEELFYNYNKSANYNKNNSY